MSLRSRLRNVFRADALSDDIDRELEFHIAEGTDELIAAGMNPGRARAEARRRFGNAGKHADDTRTSDVLGWLATLLGDCRYALRVMRAQPGPALIIGLTLAFGLSVNASVLGLMDGLLLRPYQFPGADRLVILWEAPSGTSQRDPVAPANFLDWRRQAVRLDRLVAWTGWNATLTGGQEPERLEGFRVSPGFFELIGRPPILGRSFTADEEQPGRGNLIVISDELWKRRFGSNPDVVGTTLIIDDVAHTIVGVAPPELDFPMSADVWAPLTMSPAEVADRTHRSLTVMARLGDDRSLRDAAAEMDVIASRLAATHPDANRGRGVMVQTLSDAFVERGAFALSGILQTAAALVLLVACANLAGLLLARSLDRRRELALRIALGASRGRIIRQLVTETMLLSLLASGVAVLCAHVALGALRASVPGDVARMVEGWNNVRLDWAVVWIIPALALVIGLIVALFPALTALRDMTPTGLRDGERGVIGGGPSLRGRQALVVAEIAFAMAILVAAALTTSSGARMANRSGGFDAGNLLLLQTTLPERKYGDAESRRLFVAELTDRLRAVPGVREAAAANIVPANGWSPAAPVLAEDRVLSSAGGTDNVEPTDPNRWPRAGYRSVSQGFFRTLRIPVLSGADFTNADREDGRPVAVVSRSFAQRYWPNRDPLGRRIRIGDTAEVWRTVIGVVGDVDMYNWWDGVDYDAVYVPVAQAPPAGVIHAVVRAAGEPTALAASVRQAVREVDRALATTNVRTMQAAILENSRGLNMLSMMMGVCGAIALLLAVLGIHGLMAYTIARRTHEFGVRLAFGATSAHLMGLTARRALTLTVSGLVAGLALAWALARLMAGSLEGIVALEPGVFLVVAAALGAVSLVSAYLPARRALRLDPAAILRQ